MRACDFACHQRGVEVIEPRRHAAADIDEHTHRAKRFQHVGIHGVKCFFAARRNTDQNIDIFRGDLFQVTREMLGSVDAIYDRAALVALPKEMRDRYTEHLVQIAENAPQLVIAYEYDQSVVNGPPFSVSQDEVRRHYTDSYNLTLLATADVPGGLKGKCSATEHVWLLKNG